MNPKITCIRLFFHSKTVAFSGNEWLSGAPGIVLKSQLICIFMIRNRWERLASLCRLQQRKPSLVLIRTIELYFPPHSHPVRKRISAGFCSRWKISLLTFYQPPVCNTFSSVVLLLYPSYARGAYELSQHSAESECKRRFSLPTCLHVCLLLCPARSPWAVGEKWNECTFYFGLRTSVRVRFLVPKWYCCSSPVRGRVAMDRVKCDFVYLFKHFRFSLVL